MKTMLKNLLLSLTLLLTFLVIKSVPCNAVGNTHKVLNGVHEGYVCNVQDNQYGGYTCTINVEGEAYVLLQPILEYNIGEYVDLTFENDRIVNIESQSHAYDGVITNIMYNASADDDMYYVHAVNVEEGMGTIYFDSIDTWDIGEKVRLKYNSHGLLIAVTPIEEEENSSSFCYSM